MTNKQIKKKHFQSEGIDVSFTPYSAVHHSIGHKFAHDMEHLRYPVEHHHDDKKKH